MNLLEFMPENLMTLTACNYCLGIFLKQSKAKDKFIPLFILVFSIIFSCLITGFEPMSILQGILCWGTSVGVYDIKHQLKK